MKGLSCFNNYLFQYNYYYWYYYYFNFWSSMLVLDYIFDFLIPYLSWDCGYLGARDLQYNRKSICLELRKPRLSLKLSFYSSGSHLGRRFCHAPSRGHMTKFKNFFECHNYGEGATGISWVEGRDVAKDPIMYRTDHPTSMTGIMQSHISKVLRVRNPPLQLSEMGRIPNVFGP